MRRIYLVQSYTDSNKQKLFKKIKMQMVCKISWLNAKSLSCFVISKEWIQFQVMKAFFSCSSSLYFPSLRPRPYTESTLRTHWPHLIALMWIIVACSKKHPALHITNEEADFLLCGLQVRVCARVHVYRWVILHWGTCICNIRWNPKLILPQRTFSNPIRWWLIFSKSRSESRS